MLWFRGLLEVIAAKGHGRRRCIASVCLGVSLLFSCVCRQALSYFAALGARGNYLLRHISNVEVDGSEGLGCGTIAGEVNSLAEAVLAVGFECLFDTYSVATSATEALAAFFLAMR